MKIYDALLYKMKPEKHRCIVYAKDGKSLIRPYRMLYSIDNFVNASANRNFYLEVSHGIRDRNPEIFLYESLNGYCYKLCRIPGEWSFSELNMRISNSPYFGKEGLLLRLSEAEEKEQCISLIDITLCELVGEFELAAHYREYARSYLSKMESMITNSQLSQIEEDKKREKIARTAQETVLEQAELALIRHEKVENAALYDGKTLSLLFKRYGISLPLRTHGWVNQSLLYVDFDGAQYRYGYSSVYKYTKGSSVLSTYLRQLELAILNKYANDGGECA